MSSDYILSVFITMFTIIDPIGLIPVYLSLHPPRSKQEQRKVIFRAVSVALFVSCLFLLLGKTLFHYLKIQYESIYLVGGILLFRIGLDMISAKPKESCSEECPPKDGYVPTEDIAIYPLAIPMLAGPGTLATIIMFSSYHSSVANYAVILGATIVSFISAAFAMLFSTKILHIFKNSGLSILSRVMGIILCALAVQFIINAILQILKGVQL